MTKLTREALSKLAPRPKTASAQEAWDFYVNAILDNQDLFPPMGVTNRLRWVHLISQWAHETGGFRILWESGAYSASRIMQIFGVGKHSAAVTQSEANKIASLRGEARAKALFERVYGLGNPRKARELGNKENGDGYKYRGAFICQITGRSSHEEYFCGDYSPRNIVHAALKEWDAKSCNRWADEDDIRRVTKLINGGYNGLADRESYLAKAKRIWTKPIDWEFEAKSTGVKAERIETAATGSADKPSPVTETDGLPMPPETVEEEDKSPGLVKFEIIQDLYANSKKWFWLRWQKLIGGGTAGLSFASLGEDQHIPVWVFVAALIVLGLLIWFLASKVQAHMVKDSREGRYVPSGKANA